MHGRHFNTNPWSHEVLLIIFLVTDKTQERLTYSGAQTGVTDVYGGGMSLQEHNSERDWSLESTGEVLPKALEAC